MREIPVYLFLGFLESGKTKFIQETLEDKRFNNGEKTVILLCEEGEEEYDLSTFNSSNVFIEKIDSEDELTADRLAKIEKELKPDRIMCEYNGMFRIQTLTDALPVSWIIAQTFTFVDSSTFESYNKNMRQLVFEKIAMSDLIAFNRFDEKYDMQAFHKIVRAVSRRADIIYEFKDGKVVPDDIVDPLPFDINAEVIEISERDYALWYQDLCEEMEKYNGKKLSYKVKLLANKNLPDAFIAGRDVMTCCEADIALAAIACKNLAGIEYENGCWYDVVGTLEIRFSRAYGKKGPVLNVISAKKADAPEQPVATFY